MSQTNPPSEPHDETDRDWANLLARAHQCAPEPPVEAQGPLYRAYAPLLDAIETHDAVAATRPFVLVHVAQSIDGYLATSEGESAGLSGTGDLDHLHRLRALCSAVMVGGETARLDDPQLTTRRVTGPSPIRVIVEGGTPLPENLRAIRDNGPPTWICTARGPPVERADRLVASADKGGRPDLSDTLRRLSERGVRSVLVEGGGRLIEGLLERRLVDRLQVSVAPILLGAGRRSLGATTALAGRASEQPTIHRSDVMVLVEPR